MDMRMEDCKFYSEALNRRCLALNELVCQEHKCSFYKPTVEPEYVEQKRSRKNGKQDT